MARTKKVSTRQPITSLYEAVESTYSASDLFELFGLSEGELKVWTKASILNPEGGGGPGRHKEFSLWDLVCAHVTKDLSKFLSINDLVQILKQIEFSFVDTNAKYFDIFNISNPSIFWIKWNYTEDGGNLVSVQKNGDESIYTSKRALLLNITNYFQEVLAKLFFVKKEISATDWLNFNITPGKRPKESYS